VLLLKEILSAIVLFAVPFWCIALVGATDHYNKDPWIVGVTIAFTFMCWAAAAVLVS
jgi:hypothetical protein